MSPHSALWFSLEPAAQRHESDLSTRLCKTLSAEDEWQELIVGQGRDDLEACLPSFLQQRRWFATKGEIKSVRLRDLFELPHHSDKNFIAIVMADYSQSEPEQYMLPLAFASGAESERLEHDAPGFVFARAHLEKPNLNGVVYDAAAGTDFGRMLFEVIARRRTLKSEHSEATLSGWTRGTLRGEVPQPSAQRTEERNTVIN